MTKVPDTIGKKKMDDLRRRAEKANPGMFTAKAVRQRVASNKQRAKKEQS
jgi:hypothetical protein